MTRVERMSMETDNGMEFTPSTALVAPHSLGKNLIPGFVSWGGL